MRLLMLILNSTMGKPSTVDWDSIETEYAKGLRSNYDIAKEFGISETAIRKRAKQYGWSKDLIAKIKVKALDKVRNTEFAKLGSQTITKATEAQLIESEAAIQAMALLAEREDIKRLSALSLATEAMMIGIVDNAEKHAKVTKMIVETREKLMNLYRRNLNINDNAIGVADGPVVEVRHTIIDDFR